MITVPEIEARWGVPFWDLLRDFAAQGLSATAASKALGYNYHTLYARLRRNPERNPFPPQRSKPLAYLLDTGEPFKVAVRRLAATHTQAAAGMVLGYTNQWHFQRDLKRYGLDVTFQPHGAQVTVDGITATPKQHAARLGMEYGTVYRRIQRWGLCERVFTEPLHECGRRVSAKRATPAQPPAEKRPSAPSADHPWRKRPTKNTQETHA